MTPNAQLGTSEIDEYYRKKDPRPLVFSHFARGLADKTYDEVGGGGNSGFGAVLIRAWCDSVDRTLPGLVLPQTVHLLASKYRFPQETAPTFPPGR
jgi:hypothetical protein